MSIYLYQSKKTQRYVGSKVYETNPIDTEEIDPLLIWYSDVLFINRERHLVITNPLTKFTFMIFRYSKKRYPDFLSIFRNKLEQTLNATEINPKSYLKQCNAISPYLKSNRSASAHLSRVKMEYECIVDMGLDNTDFLDDEMEQNTKLADTLVTFDKKDYDKPVHRFYNELQLRRWID